MKWKNYIEINDKVLAGKPVIKGTRLSVEHIVNLLASGWTEQQILDNYPRLEKVHLQAVFTYRLSMSSSVQINHSVSFQ